MRCEQKGCEYNGKELYFCHNCRGIFCYAHKPLDNGSDWHSCGKAFMEEKGNSLVIAATVKACRAINPADPLAAAKALPGVVMALEAILDSSETALPIELAEKAEDALNALKGETDVHAAKL